MEWKSEWKWVTSFVLLFFVLYFLPIGTPTFDNAVIESLALTKWYVREHVLLCLVPALFISGAISVFISQASVMKYFGARANKFLSYSVASVSGCVLAVCSCTILPLFAGIYKCGAGLGPAIAFLYSGPAINILAIVLTARVLGFEMGLARAVGAVIFSIVIGLAMHGIFLKEERVKREKTSNPFIPENLRASWKTALYFLSMCLVLVFANWSAGNEVSGFFYSIYSIKWQLTSISSAIFAVLVVAWFGAKATRIVLASAVTAICSLFFTEMPAIPFTTGFIGLSWAIYDEEGELGEWLETTWSLSKLIFPLLIAGVLVSGFLLGTPGNEGIIPSSWISWAVGGNSFSANFLSSVVGAFMYFATLTEVPILQGLMDNGMGKGPALALLLAGPALSLPSMLVLRSVMGTKKTITYVSLVVFMATITGMFYGHFF